MSLVDLLILWPIWLPLAIVVVGAIGGYIQEQRHLRSLAAREPGLASITVTNLKAAPPGLTVRRVELVSGNAVIAADRGKQILASLRNLVGGHVKSFERVVDRARREAYVRMLEEARRRGGDLVINVRVETSEVGGISAEALCYGTALDTGSKVRGL